MSAGCPSALQDHRFTQPEAFHCCGNQRGLRKMGRLSDRWSAGDGFPRSPDRASDRPQNHRQDLSRPSAQRGRQFGLKEESGRLPPISAPVAGQSVTPPLAPSRPPNWPPLSPPPTGYAVAWRIDRRATQAQQPPEPLRLPAPLNQLEMEAFADRFGFRFVAHELGDANRSARVERPFWFIERNFLAGRSFASWQDLNQQARQWCDRVNGTYKKHLRAVPRELFVMEQQHLRPLPVWVPEVYRLHERMVDVEGYVTVNTNRYSVPVDWIGRRVEVRETVSKIEIQLDARHLVTHQRVAEAERRHVMLAEHRPPRGVKRPDPHPEEALILKAVPEIAGYVAALKQHSRKMLILALRQLLRMVREYPREPLLAAVAEAARYGLYDLDRIERMILRLVARDYFLLNNDPESEP